MAFFVDPMKVPDWILAVLEKTLSTNKLAHEILDSDRSKRSPKFVSANTTFDGTKVQLRFVKEMWDPVDKHEQFTVEVDRVVNPVESAGIKEDDRRVIELTVENTIYPEKEVTVLYKKEPTAERVKDANEIPVEDFPAPKPVKNNSAVPEVFEKAETSKAGDKVEITFKDEVVSNDSNIYKEFFINDGKVNKIEAMTLDDTKKILSLELERAIIPDKKVTLKYNPDKTEGNRVKIKDKGDLEKIAKEMPVTNTVEPAGGLETAQLIELKKMELKFTKAMVDPSADNGKFKVHDGDENAVTGAALKDAASPGNEIIVLDLTEEVTAEKTVKIGYDDTGDVQDEEGKKLAAFSDQPVLNPKYESSESTQDGKKVIVTFDKDMNVPDGNNDKFTIDMAGTPNTVSEASVSGSDPKKIELSLENTISKGVEVKISYDDAGDVASTDNGKLMKLVEQVIDNKSIAPDRFDFSNATAEKTVELHFSVEMDDPAAQKDLFVVNDGKKNAVTAAKLKGASDAEKKVIELTVTNELTANKIIKVSYKKGSAAEGIKEKDGADIDDFDSPIQTLNPVLETAETDVDGKKVLLKFNKILDGTLDAGQFTVTVAGTATGLDGAILNTDDKTIIELELTEKIVNPGGLKKKKKVVVDYNGSLDVKSNDKGKLIMLKAMVVKNLIVPAPDVKGNGTTTKDGLKITQKFSKAMTDPTGEHTDFKFKYTPDGETDEQEITPSAVELKPRDQTTMEFSFDDPILPGSELKLNYTPGKVTAADNGVLGELVDKPITNIAAIGPTCTAETTKDGGKVILDCGTEMANPKGKQIQFHVSNGTAGSETDNKVKTVGLTKGDTKKIELVLTNPIQNGENVTVEYTAGDVATKAGGALATFDGTNGITADNTVAPPPTLDPIETTEEGDIIKLTSNETMKPPGGKHGLFKVKVGTKYGKITGAALGSGNSIIELTLGKPVVNGDVVKLEYTGGKTIDKKIVTSVDGMLADFGSDAPKDVNNNVKEQPKVETSGHETTTDGLTIKLKFNKDMASPTGMHGQFTVKAGKAGVKVNAAGLDGKRFITLTLRRAVAHGEVVKVEYLKSETKTKWVTSEEGGILDTFKGGAAAKITNKVPEPEQQQDE